MGYYLIGSTITTARSVRRTAFARWYYVLTVHESRVRMVPLEESQRILLSICRGAELPLRGMFHTTPSVNDNTRRKRALQLDSKYEGLSLIFNEINLKISVYKRDYLRYYYYNELVIYSDPAYRRWILWDRCNSGSNTRAIWTCPTGPWPCGSPLAKMIGLTLDLINK